MSSKAPRLLDRYLRGGKKGNASGTKDKKNSRTVGRGGNRGGGHCYRWWLPRSAEQQAVNGTATCARPIERGPHPSGFQCHRSVVQQLERAALDDRLYAPLGSPQSVSDQPLDRLAGICPNPPSSRCHRHRVWLLRRSRSAQGVFHRSHPGIQPARKGTEDRVFIGLSRSKRHCSARRRASDVAYEPLRNTSFGVALSRRGSGNRGRADVPVRGCGR